MQFLKIGVILLLIAVPQVLATAGCLNHKGEMVDWFVVYTTNANTKYAFPDYGYLYMDSTNTKNYFAHYKGYGNEQDAPIGLTFAQINDQDLSVVAWNDQIQTAQSKEDRYKAHSKFYMAVTADKSRGFAMSHSTPYYPKLSNDELIVDIGTPQRQKAQHHFCFTIYNTETTKNLFDYGCFMNPNIYYQKGFNTCKHWRTSQVFKRQQYTVGQYTVKAVYKNGHPDPSRPSTSPYSYEGQIFELGILPMLESSIVIQTFGSPRVKEPLCGTPYSIGNSNIISVGKYIQWSQWFDHSKWVVATDNDWVCFGDLNRNSYAQTVRGGAFYCIQSVPLNRALNSTTFFRQVRCERKE